MGPGEVIEDPLSGEPALSMYPRRGPPQWLDSVPTEFCVEDSRKAPNIAVPYYGAAFTTFRSRRTQGPARLHARQWRLDYLLVRESGIEIDGVKHRRLPARGWEAPAGS